ncbi:MAG: hypothetical protein HY821_10510 [Acidobacteria bacterium]|nr:hypothetical protein [Acidobacteriota bacterium]
MRLAILLALALPLLALDGTVVNKSTGQPQPGVLVHATRMLQSGMEPAGSAKSGADGKFQIQADGSAPLLVQAVYQGVTYTVQIPPGRPSSGLELAIYSSAKNVAEAKLDQHMILVETDGKELVVNETLVYSNTGTTTWSDPDKGTLRVYIPAEAGANLMVRAMSPNSMPVEREPRKTAEKGVYVLDFPVKPGGETRFDISYKMPAKDPIELSGKIVHAPGAVRLIVPKGITVESPAIAPLGAEPQTQAAIFDVKGQSYTLKISGAGTLRSSTPEPTEREEDGPRIQEILSPGYARYWKWALGLMLAFLALSFWLQWIRTPGSKPKA